jgi:predicted lipoprotein with Yx(FWY)xxD motif
MVNFKAVASVFVVLTVIFGATTVYMLATPQGGTKTTTATQLLTSTEMTTTTVTGKGAAAYSVNIAYKQGIGFYLVNGSGMTLYFRTSDISSNGTSTCTGRCVQVWPVFYTGNLVLPPGLNASAFTVVARPDGLKQIDYNGWPLYFFSGDKAPGDVFGQGIGGIWFAYSLPTPSQVPGSSSTSTASASTTTTALTTSATTTSTSSMSATTTSTTSTMSTTTTTTTSSTSTTTSKYSPY